MQSTKFLNAVTKAFVSKNGNKRWFSISTMFGTGNAKAFTGQMILPVVEQRVSYSSSDVSNFTDGLNAEPLFIGQLAPSFTADAVVDGAFGKVSLSDYLGKYVVLFFYPMDFTFVCPTEIIAFSDRIEEFRKLNTVVLAASTDSKFSHLEWINKPRNLGGLGEMNIPLLADKNHSISRKYKVLMEDDGFAFRGLFIIDEKGILRQITMNDLPVGRSVDETLRLIQAIQFTEKHGEVCPADWTPGSDAIDPAKSEDYFSKKK